MSNKLVLHSSAQSSAVAKLCIFADAKLQNESLFLNYQVEVREDAPKVVWPGSAMTGLLDGSRRRDELWKTTCLEAFLLFLDGSYLEMNFAPLGFWNVYGFSSYREGMKIEDRIDHVQDFETRVKVIETGFLHELSVRVDLSRAVKSPQHFRLGLASVIETVGGERSYWSLKHPGEKPDFHDSRGHVLEMRI